MDQICRCSQRRYFRIEGRPVRVEPERNCDVDPPEHAPVPNRPPWGQPPPDPRVAVSPVDDPRLYYTDEKGLQRRLVLSTDAPVTVGRSPRADVALTSDRSVSRLHAVIERIGAHWTISDDGLSRNGTFVNGERLHGRRLLRPGDSIRIGDSLMTFHGPAEAAPRADSPPTPHHDGMSEPRITPAAGSGE